MTSLPALPDSVHWSEGMLLSPQHLQQNDIYWQTHLNHRLGCASPYFRGLAHLIIDRESLAKGIVQVTELDCILDDGHVISFPGNYAPRIFSCDVADICKKAGRPVKIWAVLPRRGVDTAGVSSANKRYELLPGVPTADENLDNSYAADVMRMQARIDLYAGTTVPAQYVSCPLLEVMLDGQGQYRVTSYHPPMQRVGASAFHDMAGTSPGLHAKLTDLTGKLWTKVRELAGNRTDDMPEDSGPAGSQIHRHLSIARHLAGSLPLLEVMVASRTAHPENLYQAIAQIVGHVASIGANPVPLKMGAYNHDDCMPQFMEAFDYIEKKLSLVNTAYECSEFARFGDAGFAQMMPADAAEAIIVELTPRTGQSLADLTRWLNEARIASRELMPILQQRRMPGALSRPLTAHEIAQRNLRPHAALFLIQNQKMEVDGKGEQNMFTAGMPLLVQGNNNSVTPAAIILHRPTSRTGTVTMPIIHPVKPSEEAYA